jgi:predicted ATPase
VPPTTQLQLQRTVIANYKSVRRVELDLRNNLVVFMGRNNAGKSNLLDCFNLLAHATRGLRAAWAVHGGGFSEVVHRKRETDTVEVLLEFAPPESLRNEWLVGLFVQNPKVTPEDALGSAFLKSITLKVSFGQDHLAEEITAANFQTASPRVPVLARKLWRGKLELSEGPLEELCQAHGSGDLPVQTRVFHTALADEAAFRLCLGQPETPPASLLAAQIGGLVRAEFDHLEWMDPHRNLPASTPIRGETVIAPDAANLPDVLHWLYNNKPALFRRVETEVRRLVPHLGRLYTPTTASTATVGAMDPEDEDLFYTMGQLSYGTKSAIAVIAKLALARPGAWFSIEEPETYLHPQAQLALFQFLREESRNKRVFVATHSTPIAAATPVDSLFIVQRDASNATVASPVNPADVYRVVDQLCVQPTVDFDAEVIVFVERAEDVPMLAAWSAKHPFKTKVQFLDAEGANTPRFFANARVAQSKHVHVVVFALCGSRSQEPGPERQARERLVQLLELPSEQVVTLGEPCAAAYLLEVAALRRAFPALSLSDAELEERLREGRAQPDAHQSLHALLRQLKLGGDAEELPARIAAAMETLPAPVKSLFDRMDLASRPFWRI